MKKQGNKKMLTLRQKIVNNPIPTSLFFIHIKSVDVCPQTACPILTTQLNETKMYGCGYRQIPALV